MPPPDRRRRTRPPGEVPGGRGAGPEPTEPPDGLSALLAALGAHLERHSPAGVAVLLRSELERREFLAYANGWRDAADRYEPAPEQARRIAGSRRLRLVGSTPGRPAVIPFRQDAPASAADEGAPAATPAPARRAPDTATAAERAEPAGAGAHAGPGADDVRGHPGTDDVRGHQDAPAAPARSAAPPGPGPVAKNRNSRAPTIPRPAVRRPGRPDPRGRAPRAEPGGPGGPGGLARPRPTAVRRCGPGSGRAPVHRFRAAWFAGTGQDPTRPPPGAARRPPWSAAPVCRGGQHLF
ncbi:hypothetical protein [Streptomyces cyaneofuscatus]|uniref:hypothetical protein n=1 Tax=Streptomyces cyaneofuscatus TaxID=66883 RepID=UPI00386A0FA4|nr:hypothetical protein OG973_13705 [Streptomyces cyaneofuscatus]